jgi:hypothetical protein
VTPLGSPPTVQTLANFVDNDGHMCHDGNIDHKKGFVAMRAFIGKSTKNGTFVGAEVDVNNAGEAVEAHFLYMLVNNPVGAFEWLLTIIISTVVTYTYGTNDPVMSWVWCLGTMAATMFVFWCIKAAVRKSYRRVRTVNDNRRNHHA